MHYKRVIFDHDDFLYKFSDNVKRNSPNLVKFVPARNYLFTVRKAIQYGARHVDNPYLERFLHETEVGRLYKDIDFDSYIPARLNEEVCFKDFGKYYKHGVSEPEYFRLSYDLSIRFCETFLTEHHEVSIEDAIQSTEWSTSPGMPWVQIASVLYPGEKIGKRELLEKPYFWEHFWEYYRRLSTDSPMWCMFNVALKEEIRPKEKVEQDKTRTICAAPIEHTLACAVDLLDLHQQFMKAGLRSRMLYGFTPYYGGWDKFMKYLSKFPFANGWDASQFDSSMREWILDSVLRLIMHFLPQDCSPERKLRIRNLFSQMVHAACCLPTGDVCFKEFGNATGWFGTFMLNCLVSLFMSTFVHILETGDLTLNGFLSHKREGICGDDYVISMLKAFDMKTYAAKTGALGIICNPDYETPQKTTDVVFVSRHTVNYKGMYVSHGNPEKMWSSLKHNFSSKHPGDVIIKLCAIRRDMFFKKDIFKFTTSLILYMFNHFDNPVWSNDPMLLLARTCFESEKSILFLHTGR